LLDRYPNAVTLGEISSEDSLATMAEYTRGHRLHMGYSFELLSTDYSAAYIRHTVSQLEAQMSEGWPCWAISNHDVERVLTRWGNGNATPRLANLLTAMLCSLRGSVCVYQGEELGLTEADVPFESLRDPYGITFWPNFKGRDGCRTPMPWDESPFAGFSNVTPWLPIDEAHKALAVSHQEADAESILQGFRRFMRWRATQPALRQGDIRFLEVAEPVLAFVRTDGDEQVVAVFNLGKQPQTVALPGFGSAMPLEGHGLQQGSWRNGQLELPGHGVWFAKTRGGAAG
jgi:alpha-glucosidase